MNLNFYQSESTIRPDEVDATSSPTTVYIRRNIRKETVIDPESTGLADNSYTVFVYDEAKVPKDEYDQYVAAKTQADIEYLYMMGGLDYE